jgi:hypothetical protein
MRSIVVEGRKAATPCVESVDAALRPLRLAALAARRSTSPASLRYAVEEGLPIVSTIRNRASPAIIRA